MNDMKKLMSVLGKEKDRVPQSWWNIVPGDDDPPSADSVFVFGCPNGHGSYLQALFDKKGNLVQASIIDGYGEECSCVHCSPPPPIKKVKKSRRRK